MKVSGVTFIEAVNIFMIDLLSRREAFEAIAGSLSIPKVFKDSERSATHTTPVLQTGSEISFGVGIYDVYDTIVIGDGTRTSPSSYQSASMQGKGCGANEAELSNVSAGTILRWRGAPGKPMIHVRGPIYGLRMQNFTLECNNVAAGILLDHPVTSEFRNISVRGPVNYGVHLKGTAPAGNGIAVGCGGNSFDKVRVLGWNINGAVNSGFIIGSSAFDNIGCSSNVFDQCSVLGSTFGWVFGFSDYIRLDMCQSYFSSQACMLIRPASDSMYYPSAIYCREWSGDNLPKVLGNWNPQPNTGIVFHNYHREWNGGPHYLDSSYGPPFPPNDSRFSGTDLLGNTYNMRRTI